MDEIPKVCIDRYPDEEDVVRAAEIAIDENPRNAPEGVEGLSDQELALETGKMWENGRTLRVAFMDGHDELRPRIEELAKQWSEHANIAFDFGNHAEPEIRISFKLSGSWSYVGTDALTRPADEPTMNYGWLKPDASDAAIRRVVLHEFGHALSCIHEHQNPEGGIPWDVDKVYEYYEGEPNFWPRAQTYRNLLQKYEHEGVAATEFDPDSIMLYPIPQEFTVGDFEVGWNTELSAKDREMIARMYPKDVKTP